MVFWLLVYPLQRHRIGGFCSPFHRIFFTFNGGIGRIGLWISEVGDGRIGRVFVGEDSPISKPTRGGRHISLPSMADAQVGAVGFPDPIDGRFGLFDADSLILPCD